MSCFLTHGIVQLIDGRVTCSWIRAFGHSGGCAKKKEMIDGFTATFIITLNVST